jgi:hypothetical protein
MVEAETEPLKQSLARLHAELSRAPRLDELSRQMLRTALADIERLLHEPGALPTADAAPHHRLESLAVGFEADHPALAANLRQFIDLLGRAGV